MSPSPVPSPTEAQASRRLPHPFFQLPTSNFQPPRSGFTLIETAVAASICASAVLLLVALLPLALGSLSESADRNAHARIKQAVSARYAMMDWNLLEEWARTPPDGHIESFYFDFEGTEIDANHPDLAFAAAVRVDERRTLEGDDTHNRYLRSLEIRVTDTPQREDALEDPTYYEVLTVSLGNESKLKMKYRD